MSKYEYKVWIGLLSLSHTIMVLILIRDIGSTPSNRSILVIMIAIFTAICIIIDILVNKNKDLESQINRLKNKDL